MLAHHFERHGADGATSDAPPAEPSSELDASPVDADERHSDVRLVVRRPSSIPSFTNESISRRFFTLAAVGLVYGFGFGFSLGYVMRAPRARAVVEQSARVRLRAATHATPQLVAVTHPLLHAPRPAVAAPRPAVAAPPAPSPVPAPVPAAAPIAPDDETSHASTATSGSEYRAEVIALSHAHDGRIRDCIHHAQASGAIEPGRVRVTLVVAPDGTVRNAGWRDAHPSQVRALGCITSAIRRWHLPTFTGDRVRTVSLPIELP
jgi:hypothetical protein